MISMKKLIRYFRANWESILIEAILLQFLITGILDGNLFLAMIAAVGGLALLALIYKTIDLIGQSQTPLRGENIAFRIPRRGLIFTVGGQSDTIRMALKHQEAEYIAFICSSKTENVANQLGEEFAFDEEHIKKEVVDPQNINEIRLKTGVILNWLNEKGLGLSDIAADITGGMTTMSVGVFSMTEERHIDSQYIRSQYQDNLPIKDTQEAVFVSRYSSG
jgi:hypothetical protein